MKPFDLKSALNGLPVRVCNNNKAIIVQQVQSKEVADFLRVPVGSLIGFIEINSQIVQAAWNTKGECISYFDSSNSYDIAGMYEDSFVLIDGKMLYKPLTQDEVLEGETYYVANYGSNDTITSIISNMEDYRFRTALSAGIVFDREYKARTMVEFIASCVQKAKVNN